MAHLSRKGDVFVVRFYFQNREHKKSLKTRDADAAKAALNIVELTIHRLLTGQLQMPSDADPGDFIVSGGTWTSPRLKPTAKTPTLRKVVAEYLESIKSKISPGYHDNQSTHLRHVESFLGSSFERPIDDITPRQPCVLSTCLLLR
jgi:hypothetical protein